MSIHGGLLSFGLHYGFNESADKLIKWAETHFTDHSRGLPAALAKANDRAWEAVGLALAGESLFGWVKDVFRNADMKGVRDQIKQFLDATPTGLEAAHPDARVKAAEEWSRLRKAGRFALVRMPPAEVARRVGPMARHGDPARLTADAHRAVREEADALRADAPHLADLLTTVPADGAPLLASAFAFFFRREVETNPELAAGLTFDYLRQISLKQEQGLELLNLRTEGILDQIDVLFDALEKSFAALGAKFDVGFAGLGDKLDHHTDILIRIERRLAEPRKQGVSYETDAERQFLRQAQAEFRRNPGRVGEEAWGHLGDAMSAAQMHADAGEAHATAAATAKAAHDSDAEAANHYKAYLDACAAGAWDRAATQLWAAVNLDSARYTPFNTRRYRPVRILGGGAFGTVFLCHDQHSPNPVTRELPLVAVKTLRVEMLSRDVTKVLAEASTLKALKHPNVIGILDQDFADAERTRPYLVLEYFPGETLEAWLRDRGPLPSADVLAIAGRVATAVHAAHTGAKPVFHRDLKPANVMALKNPDGTWAVKVIDFGLAVTHGVLAASQNVPEALRSTADKSVAGTVKYAPPEQLGEMPGVDVGPYSDVYAFGKTFLELLFGHTQPQDDEWEIVHESIRQPAKKLFSGCVRHDVIGKYARLAGFEPVLAALGKFEALQVRQKEPAEVLSRTQDGCANSPAINVRVPQVAYSPDSAAHGEAPQTIRSTADGQPTGGPATRQWFAGFRFRRAIFPAVMLGCLLILLGLAYAKNWGFFARNDVPEGSHSNESASRKSSDDRPVASASSATNKKEVAPPQTPLPADPKPGEERAFEIAMGVRMMFCWVPGGKTMLGSPAGEKHRRDDEQEHAFETKGFWLGKYEVQQSEWVRVMGDTPSKFKGPTLPVEQVSWEDCQKFIGKCGVKGLKVKLPHEDDWEYACRGGKGNKQAFYWGDVLNGDKANIDGNYPYGTSTKGDYKNKTTEVGSYEKSAPHPWGLCDMSGNVYEWCENRKTTGDFGLVIRGGGWVSHAWFCRSAIRFRDDPTGRYDNLGFRLALVP